MPVNIRLLKKVRKLIAEEPRRLSMPYWGIKVKKMVDRPDNPPPCGTVACLAGWTVLAATPKRKWHELFRKDGLMRGLVGRRAAKLLGFQGPWDCPFHQTEWGVPEVLAWIDRQIDAASK